ncbi:MAG: hypothetical protein OHK0026_05740 [Rhodocyclaceae bacterium]
MAARVAVTEQLAAAPAPAARAARPGVSASALAAAALALSALAMLVATGDYYTPSSDFGYSMGLAGGLMMMALLLYPLRKRLPFMQGWAPLKYWFALHMFFGIAGPLLVLFHSTFRVGSLNAGIALGCMVLVAASGIVGRFIYRKIHRGLYGSRSSLKELRKELAADASRVETELRTHPAIQEHIALFEALAGARRSGWGERMRQLLATGIARRRTLRAIRRECAAASGQSQCAGVCEGCEAGSAFNVPALEAYLREIQRVAEFETWERMFALWHVLHVPFVYMMVASAIVHVLAVHMY